MPINSPSQIVRSLKRLNIFYLLDFFNDKYTRHSMQKRNKKKKT